MKQQILKPENWQDFEELCKVLWGEIWHCPEIKKNGRAGQNQQGVDIYGIPKNERQYFGIQCKGKDEYTKAILTEKEITNEIEKAKNFKPILKKIYFATTANKDERIEEFVRLKNVEHLENDLFEVHIFSWEDIAYLIEQNKRANDWYIKKMNFASNYKVKVVFDNGTQFKEFTPILIKNHYSYKYQEEKLDFNNAMYYKSAETQRKERIEINTEAQPVRHYLNGTSINKSSCDFSIKIENIGNSQLENFKLYINFNDNDFISERVWKKNRLLDITKYEYNIRWIKGTNDLEFKTSNEILVQNDEVITDKICVRPTIENPFCIILPWKLVSKDFTEYGNLHLILNTKIIEQNSQETYSSYFENETILENYTGYNEE
jgi:hypothetical protein